MEDVPDIVELGDCPVCALQLPVDELQSHVEAHFLEPGSGDALQLATAPGPSPSPSAYCVKCDICGLDIPIAEYDSHCLAHSLADGGAAAPSMQEEERRLREEEERFHFERLQARYGFSDKRPGKCFRCGQGGHWSQECPQNPFAQELQRPPVDPSQASAVAAAQRAASRPTQEAAAGQEGEGLGALLARRINGQQGELQAALAGRVDHYSGESADSGWGCGYRNIQMMASHLLHTRPEAQSALFGGCGYVPDILSLQAWLEASWSAGFDALGAEQLGGKVQGTRKWIGTTEAAACLRYFGLRAVIVDFVGRQAPGGAATAAGSTSGTKPAAAAQRGKAQSAGGGGGYAVHRGVECDKCGMLPIMGARWRSQVVPDYDLCGGCYPGAKQGPAAPFVRMQPGDAGGASASSSSSGGAAGSLGSNTGGGGSSSGVCHDDLIDWVWRYFHGGVPGAGNEQPLPGSTARVRLTGACPLYFQHEGHSRTIIGIERRPAKGGAKGPGAAAAAGAAAAGQQQQRQFEYHLLVLDPGTPARVVMGALRAGRNWQAQVKRGVHTLTRNDKYQVMWCRQGLASGAELEALKVLRAEETYGGGGSATGARAH